MDVLLTDVDEGKAVQRAERELDQVRDELERVDEMIAYLQRRRDRLEVDFAAALERRDGLARDHWERLAAEAALASTPTPPSPIETAPPEVAADVAPMALPDTDELMAQWGLADVDDEPEDEDEEPAVEAEPDDALDPGQEFAREVLAALDDDEVQPPDVEGHRPPPCSRLGPTLDSWGLDDDVSDGPEPTFVPISDTWRIAVVPGGGRARTRARVPTTVIREDTVPITVASRKLVAARRMSRRPH